MMQPFCEGFHWPVLIQFVISTPLAQSRTINHPFEMFQNIKDKGKGKVITRTGHEGPKREYRYSSPLSLTSVLDCVGGQHHAPAALPLGQIRYPMYRRLGGTQGCGKSRPERN